LGFSELLKSMLMKNARDDQEKDYETLSKLWSDRGIELIKIKKYEEAIVYFDKIIKVKSNDVYAWANKCSALYSLNRVEEAISCYDVAIKINTENPDRWILWRDKGISLVSSQVNKVG